MLAAFRRQQALQLHQYAAVWLAALPASVTSLTVYLPGRTHERQHPQHPPRPPYLLPAPEGPMRPLLSVSAVAARVSPHWALLACQLRQPASGLLLVLPDGAARTQAGRASLLSDTSPWALPPAAPLAPPCTADNEGLLVSCSWPWGYSR